MNHDEHKEQRERLATDVQRFLDNGGTIQQFKPGESSYDPSKKCRLSLARGVFARNGKDPK